MAVPDYLTAYEKHGGHICPECGLDLTEWSAEAVHAHSLTHWDAIDPHESFDEARRRQKILADIAKEKR